MATPYDQKHHYSTIDKTCHTANTIYLVIHILYLVLFIVTKCYIMAYITGGVILFYMGCYVLIRYKKYYLYALLCGNEYLVFVSVATMMLGFATGFYFYLIGLCVVSFFTSYFSKYKNIKGSIIWVLLSLTIFLVLYFVSMNNAPYYAIEKWLETTLFTIHAVAVFAFVATYMVVFLKYALSLENKIINESRTDELTEISNRYALYDYFDQEEEKYNKVLALFDIDDFKNINDVYGHAAGDHILKRVAKIAVKALNDAFVCRYGGEEFVIVLDEEDGRFYDKLETLRKYVEGTTFVFEDVKIQITITIGAAKYNRDITLEKWIELADKKMYSGKQTGKNKTVI